MAANVLYYVYGRFVAFLHREYYVLPDNHVPFKFVYTLYSDFYIFQQAFTSMVKIQTIIVFDPLSENEHLAIFFLLSACRV